jgi:hypothetical protein
MTPGSTLASILSFSSQVSEASASSSSSGIWVALIVTVPSTIAAVAALVSAKRAGKGAHHAEQANDAVNHRAPGEPRLLDIVKNIRDEQGKQGVELKTQTSKLDQHLGWHAGQADRSPPPGV